MNDVIVIGVDHGYAAMLSIGKYNPKDYIGM